MEKSHPRLCIRCQGLLVWEPCFSGEHPLSILKCVNCGDAIDYLILENRCKSMVGSLDWKYLKDL